MSWESPWRSLQLRLISRLRDHRAVRLASRTYTPGTTLDPLEAPVSTDRRDLRVDLALLVLLDDSGSMLEFDRTLQVSNTLISVR